MLNSVNLIGNVGQDVEVHHFDNGGMVAKFSLATSESYTKKDGEKVTNVEWHNIQIFGKKAEIAEKYVKKGDKLFLEGKIKYRSYESDGTTKYITEIVLEEYRGQMIMLGGKKDGDSGSKTPPPPPAENSSDKPLETDDLPF